MATTSPAVETQGLTKVYKDFWGRDKVRALTPADLQATAQKYFDSANMQIVLVGDRDKIETQATLFGDLDIYDAQGNRLP